MVVAEAATVLPAETVHLRQAEEAFFARVPAGETVDMGVLVPEEHLAQLGCAPQDDMLAYLHGSMSDYIIKVDTFAVGDHVDVVGTSKGKGYAGVIKRWNFHRLKESHGTGPVARHSGSQGVIDPARVFKGMKGAGHLGAERVTVQNLEIVKIDVENNLIAIKGAIPGPRKGIVVISDTVKA